MEKFVQAGCVSMEAVFHGGWNSIGIISVEMPGRAWRHIEFQQKIIIELEKEEIVKSRLKLNYYPGFEGLAVEMKNANDAILIGEKWKST